MNVYLAELVGTALLVLLGNGVVANVLLDRTKGHGGGWIVIAAGWGFAVFVAVFCVADVSGAHINPAVTVGLCAAGAFDWAWAPGYVTAQVLGGFLGGGFVYLFYRAWPVLSLSFIFENPANNMTAGGIWAPLVGTFYLAIISLMIDAPIGILAAIGIVVGGITVLWIAWNLTLDALWQPIDRVTLRRLLFLAEVQPGEHIVDLGCGDGRIVVAAAKETRNTLCIVAGTNIGNRRMMTATNESASIG